MEQGLRCCPLPFFLSWAKWQHTRQGATWLALNDALGDFHKYCGQLNALALVDAFGCCLLHWSALQFKVWGTLNFHQRFTRRGTGGQGSCSSLLPLWWLHTVSLIPVTLWCLTLSLESITSLRLSLPVFPPHVWTTGYAEAQFRQYQRLTKQIRPDLESYEKQREE